MWFWINRRVSVSAEARRFTGREASRSRLSSRIVKMQPYSSLAKNRDFASDQETEPSPKPPAWTGFI